MELAKQFASKQRLVLQNSTSIGQLNQLISCANINRDEAKLQHNWPPSHVHPDGERRILNPVAATKAESTTLQAAENGQQSTIAILRRHPMYDSLVLVKRHKPGQGDSFTLEFPGTLAPEWAKQEASAPGACTGKLVSVLLDGDDPVYQHREEQYARDKDGGELVYVPINGLIERLDQLHSSQSNVQIDGRVYAFAMGLRTAERILISSTMKEVQETPQI